jgi:hypothetical protein
MMAQAGEPNTTPVTDDELLTLVEAFRLVLRDRRPGPLADEINSYDDIHFKADDMVGPKAPGHSYLLPLRDQDVIDDAVAAAKLIEDAIRDCRLPVIARRGGKGPFEPAGRLYQRFSRPHVFESELRLYEPGRNVVDKERSWSDCLVRRADVLWLIAPPVPEVPDSDL